VAASQRVFIMNRPSGRRPTVLVVEDIDYIRAGLKRSAGSRGYLVLEASDAEEAVSVAEATRPDLILTEEQLPTFAALLRRVREHPALCRIPVVIVNPDAEEGTRYGDAVVLTDYDQMESLLATPASTADRE
jgi:CheY-like chemotaxis protein